MNSLPFIGFILLLIHIAYGRVFDMCSLAKELHFTHGISKHELPDWVCMAQHESSFNTAAINYSNSDGSYDFGIFQINDRYWCENTDRPAIPKQNNGCGINCKQLLTDDITVSVRCAQKIKSEMGWKAWEAWKTHCQTNKPDVSICFGGINLGHGYGIGFGC